MHQSEIEPICRKYFGNKGSLQKCEVLSGGAVNVTFKVQWNDEWFVLRFYVRDKSYASIERQVYQLIETTIAVPEMFYISSEDESHPFALFRFYPMPHIYELSREYSHKLCYDLGVMLAKIHRFHFAEAGLFGKDLTIEACFKEGSSPYFEYSLEHLTPSSLAWKRLGEKRAKDVVSFMEKYRAFFPMIQDGGCLVHSDFKPVNLLWDETQGLKVLDWEFAHSGHGLMDFAILLRHYRDFPLHIPSLERGYREHGGELPADWIPRARITDFINVIQLLNNPLERPQLFQSLIESIDDTRVKWKTIQRALIL